MAKNYKNLIFSFILFASQFEGYSGQKTITLDVNTDAQLEWTNVDCLYANNVEDLINLCPNLEQIPPIEANGFWSNCLANCSLTFFDPNFGDFQVTSVKIRSYIKGQLTSSSVSVDGKSDPGEDDENLKRLYFSPFSFWDQEILDVSFVQGIKTLKVNLQSQNLVNEFVVIDRIEIVMGEFQEGPTPKPEPEPENTTPNSGHKFDNFSIFIILNLFTILLSLKYFDQN